MPTCPDLDTVPTFYEILGITASLLEEQKDPNQALKRAYHKALLRHHPDKKGTTRSVPQSTGAAVPAFSVDQLSAAFAVLSDPKQRADYDAALRLATSSGGQQRLPHFQTGIENVDLDDLEYDEAGEKWFRGCRCGNPRGYLFGEADLEEAAELGELMVGCADCSLWLRVHFAVVEGELGEPPGGGRDGGGG